MHEQPGSPDPQTTVLNYEQLASASPVQRRSLVLALIAQHPDNLLKLPRKDGVGANLNGIDLSQEKIIDSKSPSERLTLSSDHCPVMSLARAELPGASLEMANLSGLDLSHADLSGAVLRKAKLCRANFEQSTLENADLAGAKLKQAAMGKSNLQGAKFEEADLRAATMRFSQLQSAVFEDANLQGADLWGSNLRNAVLRGANLRDVVLNEADLEAADASEADFGNASFVRANLAKADFSNSDLRGANLLGAVLRGTILSGTRLSEVDLSSCDVRNACFAGAWLDRTRMSVDQLAGAAGEELSGDYDAARTSYVALERNFKSLGDSDAAGWAYLKRRRMQKKVALRIAIDAIRSRQLFRGLHSIVRYVSDQMVECACDYGESIPRVLASILVIYLFFMAIYGITGSVTRIVETPNGTVRVVTRELTDLAIFSLLAMTTSGSPTVGLQPRHEMVHLLTGVQALLGIALTGLLGFVIGNRIRR